MKTKGDAKKEDARFEQKRSCLSLIFLGSSQPVQQATWVVKEKIKSQRSQRALNKWIKLEYHQNLNTLHLS